MAQTFVTDVATLIIPGSYPEITVQASNSAIATSGVLMIVGEADAGPDFTKETDLGKNTFGPDEGASVLAKYKSGNIVDAFQGAVAASNDPGITGSFASAIIVKTNPSTQASGPLLNTSAGAYGTLSDRSYGKLGNLISYKVSEAVSEVGPLVTFAALSPTVSISAHVRVNGGSSQALSYAAGASPATLVSSLSGLTGVVATGGAVRNAIASVAGTVALAIVSGNTVTVTYSLNWGQQPAAGDTMYISANSVLAASNAPAAGSYIVESSTSNTVTATKKRDVTGAHNALTTPTPWAATEIISQTEDVEFFSPVTVTVTATDIPGVGKSLEIVDDAAGPQTLADVCFSADGTVNDFFSESTAGGASILVSSAERQVDLTLARQADNITEDVKAGGKVALALGYVGDTATAVNDGTNLTLTVTGGSGSSPAAIPLKNYKTISDLAAYISTLPGFSAAPGTATLGSSSPLTLDVCTVHFASTNGGNPGRIKQDGYAFFTAVNTNSVLATLVAEPPVGLPGTSAGFSFFTGGTVGGTTDAIFSAACDKLKLVRGNFLIPLFSRDADGDIADGLTDSSSSYTIAGVHSFARAHVLAMSTMKARRNRQAFLSIRDTFSNDETVAANLASYRCSCAFQDANDVGASGPEQFQPWMTAIKAAAMQAGAFYKPIFNKLIAANGFVQAAGDFSDQDDSATENALNAGLLPVRQDETGGWHFVSDQTTYTADSNFVFNSIQAVYVGDLIALTTTQRMEKAFVGQNIADTSASLALGTLEAIMSDLLRLKLISPSDDAPKGFRNAKVTIKGPAMVVSVEVKLAGAIYFVPISFLITEVQQSA